MNTLLIASTDTDAGKTIITTALRAYYQQYFPQVKIGLMKLLQTGMEGDAEFYQRFFDDVITPLRFDTPVAPPIAAELEHRSIDLDIVGQNLLNLQKNCDLVLLEGLGGLGSPITNKLTLAHIAGRWHLDTILVVPVKLGSIAHTVANVALAHHHKVKLKGIIFNGVNPCSNKNVNNWTPKELVESLTQVPVLGYFPYLETIDNLSDLALIISQNISIDD